MRERFLKTNKNLTPIRNHDSRSDLHLDSAACQPSAEAGAGPVGRPQPREPPPPASRACPDEFDGGRARRRRGAGGWRWESAAFPAPLPKVPGLRALVKRSLVSLVRLRLGPPLKLFTHPTSRWKWRIDASAPRAPRAARSYRLGVQCAQRVAPRELALPGMRRTAHRSENLSATSGVWRKRPRSRPHLRRPPQLAKVWVWVGGCGR